MEIYTVEGGNGYWTQCADMPTEAGYRSAAVGFAVNGKGYVSTGIDIDSAFGRYMGI